MKVSEETLAEKVVAWLQEMKWDVYQEVQMDRYGRVCDIVAIQNKVSWFIEVKTTLGIDVIEQAQAWRWSAHYVSVATPIIPRPFVCSILRNFGIGAIFINTKQAFEVREDFHCQLNRHADKRVFYAISEEHKVFAKAGTNSGQHWSPFKQTCQAILDHVERNPGVSLSDLMKEINTHYRSVSTARACIKKWAEVGSIPGVELKREGRAVRFYPVAN